MGKVIGIIVVILLTALFAYIAGKFIKSNKVFKLLGILLAILFLVSAILPYTIEMSDNLSNTFRFIGIGTLLLASVIFAVLTCRSKNCDLYKWVFIGIFIALCISWIVPYGYYTNGEFAEYSMNRLGLTDIATSAFYSIYFCLSTLIYLLVLGGFYGIISKTKGYRMLVTKFAKAVRNNLVVSTIIITMVLVFLTSFIKTPFAVLVFIPFIVSVLLNAKFDKVSAMGISFGSLLVGMVAATYGTDGLYWLNSYLSTDIKVGLTLRFIFAGITLVLFVLFTLFRTIKVVKNNKAEEENVDPFEVTDARGKNAIWPTITILSIVFILVVLGYVDWKSNFGITCFSSFHTWLTELSLGEEFPIFSYILGTSSAEFGTWEVTCLIPLLLIASLLVVTTNGIKLKEAVGNFAEGLCKMLKPLSLYILAYLVFVLAYMTQFMAYISEVGFSLTSKFNPYITTLVATITSIFHCDLGYTGYLVGSVITGTYASSLDIVHTIYVTTYGLTELFIPTGGLLLIGLSYLKISYKEWFKYIWLFAAVMFVALIIFVTFATYVF